MRSGCSGGAVPGILLLLVLGSRAVRGKERGDTVRAALCHPCPPSHPGRATSVPAAPDSVIIILLIHPSIHPSFNPSSSSSSSSSLHACRTFRTPGASTRSLHMMRLSCDFTDATFLLSLGCCTISTDCSSEVCGVRGLSGRHWAPQCSPKGPLPVSSGI